MELTTKHTRFRAYQLKSNGSSFSYWDGSHFTLCEARYNDDNKASIWHELRSVCRKSSIDTLHITSWDVDHCNNSELTKILSELRPSHIEVPGYSPHTDQGNASLKQIDDYLSLNNATFTINSSKELSVLPNAIRWDNNNCLWSKDIAQKPNDNSSIKLFRTGCFTVLSLGDIESSDIAQGLLSSEIMCEEVDILILSHHGADNGFTSDEFLKGINPKIAIALCDWGNRYSHPNQSIIQRLNRNAISYYSTKQGDVIIESIDDHRSKYKVWNYISNGDRCESVSESKVTKKAEENQREMFRRYSYLIRSRS
ncbi:MAG: hypothetical protein WCS62_05785 [Bacilli bacterium]